MTDVSAAASPPKRRTPPATGTDTVTVACNLPNGLILQVYDVEVVTNYLPNGREIKENVATLNLAIGQHVLNGQKLDHAALAAANMPDYRVIRGSTPDTGYALTSGVPRDLWEAWLSQNKTSPLVANRHVYASSTESRAADEAREYKDIRSGLQGLNQAGDYRVPNGRSIRKYSPSDNRITPEQAELPPTE